MIFHAVLLPPQQVLLVTVERLKQQQCAMTVSERGQLARDLDQQIFFQGDCILQRREIRQPRRAEDRRHNLTGRTEVAARLQVAPRFIDAGLPFRPVRVQPVECRLAANRGNTQRAIAKRGLVFADAIVEA